MNLRRALIAAALIVTATVLLSTVVNAVVQTPALPSEISDKDF